MLTHMAERLVSRQVLAIVKNWIARSKNMASVLRTLPWAVRIPLFVLPANAA